MSAYRTSPCSKNISLRCPCSRIRQPKRGVVNPNHWHTRTHTPHSKIITASLSVPRINLSTGKPAGQQISTCCCPPLSRTEGAKWLRRPGLNRNWKNGSRKKARFCQTLLLAARGSGRTSLVLLALLKVSSVVCSRSLQVGPIAMVFGSCVARCCTPSLQIYPNVLNVKSTGGCVSTNSCEKKKRLRRKILFPENTRKKGNRTKLLPQKSLLPTTLMYRPFCPCLYLSCAEYNELLLFTE